MPSAQIPILSGIYTSSAPDVRQSFPVNMVAVGLKNGVSNGYMRPAPGVVEVGEGSGSTRGQIQWLGVLYAVQGTDFVSIAQDGTIVVLGTVAAGNSVRMVYGVNHLAIASGGRLYLWDLSSLTEVTDSNLGVVIDVTWIGGYFAVTDGTIWRVSDLNDPFVWPALAFDEPASQPDPTVAILRVRNQVALVGATTIEIYGNFGTQPFPFGVIQTAQIQKGCVGTYAACVFVDAIAFVGGGLNEQPAVYLGSGGQTQKLSTREIDLILASYPAVQLAETELETRNEAGQELLYIHLPDRTLMFDATASEIVGQQVWSILTSTLSGFSQYRARFFTYCFDRWNCGDPSSSVFGYLDNDAGDVYGDHVRCELATPFLFNDAKGVFVNQLDLTGLFGSVPVDVEPTIALSWSQDGQQWSQPKTISAGKIGERSKLLTWRRIGRFKRRVLLRFSFTSEAHISLMRLDADVDGAWH